MLEFSFLFEQPRIDAARVSTRGVHHLDGGLGFL